MPTTLLKNCLIVSPTGTKAFNILIEEKKIKKILDPEETTKADNVIDIEGKHVLPGIIDTHVHFRTPGAEYKEDWETGSFAAAAGGVTTVIDMPNTNPPTTTPEQLEKKRETASKQSLVNFGFFYGIETESEKNNTPKNIAGVKVYLNVTTGGYKITNKEALKKIFSKKARFALHAEGNSFQKALKILAETDNPVHLCHASRAEEIELARVYKKQGMKLSIEVSPHHLFLKDTDEERLKGFGVMKPPLESKDDQDSLWKGIADGTVDTIATDHAPHTKEEKISSKPPYGVPGLETSLPLMLNAVNEKKITLEKVVTLMSKNPAQIFSIQNKGEIALGYSADLTIVDINLTKKIRNENLYTKCAWSPFHGWKLTGWPIMTFVNGILIFKDGKIINKHNMGTEIIFDN